MELLEDLKEFDPSKRTAFDRSVSAMIALVGGLEPIYKPPPPKVPLINVYVKGVNIAKKLKIIFLEKNLIFVGDNYLF